MRQLSKIAVQSYSYLEYSEAEYLFGALENYCQPVLVSHNDDRINVNIDGWVFVLIFNKTPFVDYDASFNVYVPLCAMDLLPWNADRFFNP